MPQLLSSNDLTMKKHIILLFVAFTLVTLSRAAFPIRCKPVAANADSVKLCDIGEVAATTPVADGMLPLVPAIPRNHKRLLYHRHQFEGSKRNWPGLIALLMTGLFAPAAIAFGISGLNYKYKNRGLALAALILAGIEILLVVTFYILAFAFGIVL